jgi:hypothetical protein
MIVPYLSTRLAAISIASALLGSWGCRFDYDLLDDAGGSAIVAGGGTGSGAAGKAAGVSDAGGNVSADGMADGAGGPGTGGSGGPGTGGTGTGGSGAGAPGAGGSGTGGSAAGGPGTGGLSTGGPGTGGLGTGGLGTGGLGTGGLGTGGLGTGGNAGAGNSMTVSFGEGLASTYKGVTTYATLNEGSPTLNDSGVNIMSVCGTSGARSVVVLRFDVSALPTSAIVTAVELHLTTGGSSSSTGSVEVHQVLEPWIEAQATWNDRMTATAWTGAGCGTGSRDPTVLGSCKPYSKMTTYTVPLLTNAVQAWAANPVQNFGFALVGTSDADNTPFRSYQSVVPQAARPLLVVTYHL